MREQRTESTQCCCCFRGKKKVHLLQGTPSPRRGDNERNVVGVSQCSHSTLAPCTGLLLFKLRHWGTVRRFSGSVHCNTLVRHQRTTTRKEKNSNKAYTFARECVAASANDSKYLNVYPLSSEQRECFQPPIEIRLRCTAPAAGLRFILTPGS